MLQEERDDESDERFSSVFSSPLAPLKRVLFSDTPPPLAGASYFRLDLISKTRWASLPCAFARPTNRSMGGYNADDA